MTPVREPEPWSESVREKDSPARTRFLESHVELVRYLALRLLGRLPASVDVNDLVHDGILGLLDATERFDPCRGVRFRTYAETRIRGAILDGLRGRDWRPRSLRQMKRSLDSALAELSTAHGRAATEEEIAEALGVSLGEYREFLSDLSSGSQLSLEDLPSTAREATSDTAERPDSPLERGELIRVLAEEIAHLGERERLVLELYYFKELNMKEVGAVLGVTESRVCQLHSQAAARLRVALSRRLHATAEREPSDPVSSR